MFKQNRFYLVPFKCSLHVSYTVIIIIIIVILKLERPGPFPAILGKGPWPKLGKNDQLNVKIGRN